MKHSMIVATAVLGLSLFHAVTASAADDMKRFEWKNVSFRYPAAWKVQEIKAPTENSHRLLLNSQTNPPVTVSMNLTKDASMLGADPSQAGKIGESFCLPSALKLAKKAEEKIYHMPTRIQVAGKSSQSVLMMVEREAGEQKTFSSLHCFATYDPGTMALGAIISGGVRGKILNQAPFLEATEQAYDMLDSIRFH